MVMVMGCLGVALAGVQLLPTLNLISASSRLGSSDYAFASRFSWPVGYIVTLLVPNFFGEPVLTGYWGDGIYDEMIFYVGLLPLMLVYVAGRISKDQQTRNHALFWLCTAGVSLLAAFGSNGILHRLLYRFVPLFSSMRAPARAGFLFTISTAALTALAVHTLTCAGDEERISLVDPFTPSRIFGILAITSVLAVSAYGVYAWGKNTNADAGRFWHMANAIAVFGLFFSLAAGWLRRWVGPSPSRHLAPAALVIILLDLWTLGGSLVRIVPAPLSSYWEIVAQHAETYSGRVLPWGLSIFEQNGALSFELKSVFAYNPLEDQNYNLLTASNPDPRARTYDLLNVMHVTTTVPLDLAEDDSLDLVVEDRGVYIYSRSTAMPQAWIASEIESIDDALIISRINDPDYDPLHTTLVKPGTNCPQGNIGSVIITKGTEPERIIAHIDGDGGVVVFSERYTSGWVALLDGENVPIIKVNGILRGVCVPSGTHDLQFHYEPPGLKWGILLSGLSVGAICTMLWRAHFRKRA